MTNYEDYIHPGDLDSFKTLPDEDKTKQLCMLALEKDPTLYCFVPLSMYDQSMIELIWFDDSYELDILELISFFKDKQITIDMWEHAVKANVNVIEHIPTNLIDSRLANAIVSADPLKIYIIPEYLITKEMCLEALSNSSGDAIQIIPSKFSTYDMWLAALQLGYSYPDGVLEIPGPYIVDDIREILCSGDFFDALEIGYHVSPLTDIEKINIFKDSSFLENLREDFLNISAISDGSVHRYQIATIQSLIESKYPDAWHAFQLGCDAETISTLIENNKMDIGCELELPAIGLED